MLQNPTLNREREGEVECGSEGSLVVAALIIDEA